MEPEKLAQAIRARLVRRNMIPQRVANAVPDAEVIDSYCVCSCCGERMIEADDRDKIVAEARHLNYFLAAIDGRMQTHRTGAEQ